MVIPKRYKAYTVLIPVKDDAVGLGGLSGLVKDFVPIKGGSSSASERFISILNSDTLLLDVIFKFDLVKRYDVDEYPLTKTLEILRTYYFADLTEDGNIFVEFIDTSPDTTKLVLNYVIKRLNELNHSLSNIEANNNLFYINNRYVQITNDLFEAENKFTEYQKKNNIFDIELQSKALFSAYSELSLSLFQLELKRDALQLPDNSPTNQMYNTQIDKVKERMSELENTGISDQNLIPSIKRLPNLGLEFFRLKRDVEVKLRILAFITPLIEQAKLNELKKIPSVTVLDNPRVPERKDSPKRLYIVLASIISVSILILFFYSVIFRIENKNV